MKNKLVLVLVSGIVLFFAGVVSLLSVFYAKKGGSLVYMDAELKNTIEIPLSEADSLLADYGSKNLEVYVWQEDKILIKEYLCNDGNAAKATVEFEGSKAVVTGGKWFWSWRNLFWGGMSEKIEVYLPAQGIQELELVTGSGNISGKGNFALETKKASIRAGSGNIRWQSTGADEIILYANSGNIRGDDLNGDTDVHTGSGNITVKGIQGNVGAEAGSGNITIEELAGGCEAEAGSGNIRIEAAKVTGDIVLHTGSGNQKLELPEGLSFSIQVNTRSGNIHTDYNSFLEFNEKGNKASGQVGDEPVCRIASQAGSGNVTIKKH